MIERFAMKRWLVLSLSVGLLTLVLLVGLGHGMGSLPIAQPATAMKELASLSI
jgi:hypothetical protein